MDSCEGAREVPGRGTLKLFHLQQVQLRLQQPLGSAPPRTDALFPNAEESGSGEEGCLG